MVRFIISRLKGKENYKKLFTFQYGQIYYQRRVKKKRYSDESLHSNMVRFIIKEKQEELKADKKFTFQYGQIYYYIRKSVEYAKDKVYIPIWLDLL